MLAVLGQSCWELKRNCSLSPYQLLGLFASMACVSMGVALAWAWQGNWPILPFAVLECLALGLAFMFYCRHAQDRERVVVTPSELQVDDHSGSKVVRLSFSRIGLRVKLDEVTGLIAIQSQGQESRIGRFLTRPQRQQFLKDLLRALAEPNKPFFHQAGVGI
ncbi:MAG: DUF2244 domain-containing protein [Burkholderiaceae bacterium]